MLQSGNNQVDELLATESHHLRKQKIREIWAAMELQPYGAENVATWKRTQFQARLNSARQVATIWSDAEWQKPNEPLERKLHQLTPAKLKLFDKLLQHHERHLLQEVGVKATSPGSLCAKYLA